jgi:uncharacterized protein YfbU (UPF0304 family)
VKLTDGEKLILLMLADLHEKVAINGDVEPGFLRSAIFNDQLWGIRWKYSGIPFEPAEDPPVVREVIDILDMWSLIEFSYSKLNDEQKASVAREASPFGENPRFHGFDGNGEGEHMSIALFLVNHLDRFQEFKGRDFNCHHPSIDAHRRMLASLEPIRRSLLATPLSAEQLSLILKEQVHPSQRQS